MKTIQLLAFMPSASASPSSSAEKAKAEHAAIHTLQTVLKAVVAWREASQKAAAASAAAASAAKEKPKSPFEAAKALRSLKARTVSDPPAPGSSEDVAPIPSPSKRITIQGNTED